MRRSLQCALGIGMMLMLCLDGSAVGQRPSVSPRDCVNVKYITGLWINTSGTKVAYLVKAPNIEQNRNDYQLYVKTLGDASLSMGSLLVSGVDLSDVKWFDDDNHLALLMSTNGLRTLLIIDVLTGVQEHPIASEASLDSYSIDSSGSTIAYSVANPSGSDNESFATRRDRIASGYRVSSGERPDEGYTTKSIYIRHRERDGHWSSSRIVSIENPFTHIKTTRLPYPQSLSLSPDGKRLLVTYRADGIPDEWRKSPFVKSVSSANPLMSILVLYNVDSENTTLGFKTVFPDSLPLWSNDSQSFLINAHSPIGSIWEADDIRDHHSGAGDANLFAVRADSGEVEEVIRHVPEHHEAPLVWQKDGDVIVHTLGVSVARLHRVNGSWLEAEHLNVPHQQADRIDLLASNGRMLLGVHETVSAPENLFVYQPGLNQIRILTDLNPQIRAVQLANVKTIHWAAPGGLNISGLLFMPADYSPGTRYPLVIQTKGDQGWFTCDSGANHDPSFAPQPIASAGMMYLIRTFSEDWNAQEARDKRPSGYPGNINEAVQEMDIWDSAVEFLDKEGLIDSKRVGILGFSRTGWEVEFDLVHAKTRYAAATVTDNIQYSLSEYWLEPWGNADAVAMYGGPPYGQTLENWRKYSISFNLDKMHTPLLMEEMGYGAHDDGGYLLARNLAVRYEITRGLADLGKPAEMYYYPDETHQLDHPRARLASLQRNVDWYRFWLQGYEDDVSSKREQYSRWRELRKLHEQDSNSQQTR